MGDSNVWDMMEESTSKSRRSMSPSRTSRVDSEIHLEDVDVQALHALGLGKDELVEEVERAHQKRRSKSPALESLRKASTRVFQRLNILPKKRTDVFPLFRSREIDLYPLDDHCARPKEWCREPKPFSFRDLGVINLPVAQSEKCSYLFRGASAEEEPAVAGPTEIQRLEEYDPYCPVHGSRRRFVRSKQKLVTMQSIMSSVDHDEDDLNGNIAQIYSQEFVAKIIRKKRIEQETPAERLKNRKTMQKIKSNLWIISLSFLALFTAFHGLQSLQTTINGDLGADSLIVFYTSLAISATFIPTFMIDRLGCKLTIATSMSIYIVYLTVNTRPTYYSLIPASVLAGAAASCLWGAKCVYIVEMGVKYSRTNYENSHAVIFRFFGYFFMIVHLGQVIGNYISSKIFLQTIPQHSILDQADKTCGHSFPGNETFLTSTALLNLQRPPQRVYMTICLVYIACAIVAVLILTMFLNALTRDAINRQRAPSFNPEFLKMALKNICNAKMYLLVPLTIFNGIGKAFLAGVFTKNFVACGLGVTSIGFVSMSFGISDAICSIVFGPLIKLFGRMPLFVFGAVVNLLMLLMLMIWPVNPADTAIFYVVAAVWGMADGVWNTQINGFWVALFGRQSLDFAFTNYRIWESLGIALGFLMIRLVKVNVYLYISTGVLLVGMAGYSMIENYERIESYLHHLFFVCTASSKKKVEVMEESMMSRATQQTNL